MTTLRSRLLVPATGVRLLALGAALTGALLLGAGPASAHVSVTPSTAEPGGFTHLAFSVPNERDDATTTQVEVVFPADQPLASASVRPVPGWKATVQTAPLATPLQSDDGPVTEAVSRITWTGGPIVAGQYQDFEVSVGPLPENATTMVFKALQTYSDGSVVRWIDLPTAGGAEPEHPAPTLTVAKAAAAPAATPAKAASAATAATKANGSTDWTGRILAGLALLVALGAAGLAFLGRRGSAPSAPTDQASQEPPMPAQRKTRTRA